MFKLVMLKSSMSVCTKKAHLSIYTKHTARFRASFLYTFTSHQQTQHVRTLIYLLCYYAIQCPNDKNVNLIFPNTVGCLSCKGLPECKLRHNAHVSCKGRDHLHSECSTHRPGDDSKSTFFSQAWVSLNNILEYANHYCFSFHIYTAKTHKTKLSA